MKKQLGKYDHILKVKSKNVTWNIHPSHIPVAEKIVTLRYNSRSRCLYCEDSCYNDSYIECIHGSFKSGQKLCKTPEWKRLQDSLNKKSSRKPAKTDIHFTLKTTDLIDNSGMWWGCNIDNPDAEYTDVIYNKHSKTLFEANTGNSLSYFDPISHLISKNNPIVTELLAAIHKDKRKKKLQNYLK